MNRKEIAEKVMYIVNQRLQLSLKIESESLWLQDDLNIDEGDLEKLLRDINQMFKISISMEEMLEVGRIHDLIELVRRKFIELTHKREREKGEKVIDWEQRHYELSRAAMQGLIASGECRTAKYFALNGVAVKAISLADEMIEQLKSKSGEKEVKAV